MQKLLTICGPTATGKTKLALYLSKLLDGEIVSADSRQIYKSMDIGTGKDLPEGVIWRISDLQSTDQKPIGFWETNNGIRLWGYDLVNPEDKFSVARYIPIARMIIGDIWTRNKTPILVGGTGLYIKGTIDGIPTADIPQIKSLRNTLSQKNAGELYEILAVMNPIKAASMNISDRKNPRRLTRAIEISEFELKHGKDNVSTIKFTYESDIKSGSHLFIGLSAPRQFLNKIIANRVKERVNRGFDQEVDKLITDGVKWGMQSMQSLGYSRWSDFLSGNKTKEEVVNSWIVDESNYAKRQMVWFKKDKRIKWFDISDKNWKKKVVKKVEEWHNK